MNRQCFPASLFPMRGDVSAEVGATTIQVVGLQGIPIISPPVEPAGLDTLFYDSYNNDWFYASPWDIPVGIPLVWEGYGYGSSGISWIAPDTLAFGNGTDGDVSGAAAMTALILFGSNSYYGPYGDYDVDYGPSYDQFYTSIFSGATQNWNLVLPPNPGSNGQVLTTNGTGVTAWTTVSGGGGTSPGGSSGDIQYNNTGAFGGSASTITAGGTITLPTTQAVIWGTDTSISRISGGLIAIGSGSVGSETGGIILNTINLGDEFYDNTDYAGANGWVLSSTGTKTLWINPATSLAVPGSTGDILYNNGGVMGASLATITSTGSITLPDTQVIRWTGAAYSGVGLSQLAADTLAVGNGSDSDVSGAMAMTGLILFGSSYYSAYDAFHTTIYSGATQNWNLVLPETAGVAGQVLTNIGSGFTEWETLSAIGVPWSSITNPTANLALTMGADTTTFNYATSLAAAWLWANNTPTVTGASTTVALSTSTAPTHSGGVSWTYTLAASESGAGSNGWVNAVVTTSGWTGGATGNNGTNLVVTASTTTTVTITNPTGTTINTGTPVMISTSVSSSPVLQIAGTVNTGTAGTLNSAADVWSIQDVIGSVAPNPTSTLTFSHSGSSGAASVSVPNLIIATSAGTISGNSCTLEFASGVTYVQTSGTIYVALCKNTTYEAVFVNSTCGFSWSSGSVSSAVADTTITRNAAGIVQIGTTAANASGNLAANSFAANGVVASPTAGVYYSGGTAGVSAGPFAAITSIQTIGGIVTTLADVSDERLKDHSPYTGGLKEILGITPIKYTWNSEGQKLTGFSEDRLFIGFRAQDIQKVIPEAVTQSASNPEYLGFDDRPVVAALVNAIKELKAEIDVLKKAYPPVWR